MKHAIAIVAACLALLLVWIAWDRRRSADGDREPQVFGDAAFATETSQAVPAAVPRAPEPASSRREASTAAAATGAGRSRLGIRVLAQEDGRPLAGVGFHVGAECGPIPLTPVGASLAPSSGHPVTDEDGSAEFEVPSDRPLLFGVSSSDSESRVFLVDPLAAGARREVEWRLRTQPDYLLHGILLDGETQQGISDGVLELERPQSGLGRSFEAGEGPEVVESVRARPDGCFELRGRSWMTQYVRASAPGHALAVFPLISEQPLPARPLEIRLWRSATLEVRVEDAAGTALAGVPIDVAAELRDLRQSGPLPQLYNGLQLWRGRSDDSGKVVLRGLPPRVALQLAARMPGKETNEQGESLRLAPAEYRRISLCIEGAAVIHGQALNEAGNPIAGRMVWRVAGRSARGTGVLFDRLEDPAAQVRTDAEGRFRFDGVTVGLWSVGLAPDPRSELDPSRSLEGAELPPCGETLEVPTAHAVVEVNLRVRDGRMLRGRVVDPSTLPVSRCRVDAWCEGLQGFRAVECDPSGNFVIGPVPPGAWTLVAKRAESDLAPSSPVVVDAGSDPVVLVLRRAYECAGRVVRAEDGRVGDCELAIGMSDPAFLASVRAPDGRFSFRGLPAGSYVLMARDLEGRAGILTDLRLEGEERRRECVVELRPGARLRVRHSLDLPVLTVELAIEGCVLQRVPVRRAEALELTLPPGSVELSWVHESATRSKTVVVAPGDTLDVVLEEGR